MISLVNISKSYDGQRAVIDNFSLQIAKNELMVLVGASGCGKTTIIKMINRIVEPTNGTIFLEGIELNQFDAIHLRRSMGYVFQSIGLFPHLTVEENVGIILQLNGMCYEQRRELAHFYLDMVDLSPALFAQRYPHELSGGQQQRVGVARALIIKPKILLMDEPFGSLDAINRYALQNIILQLKQSFSNTIVFVTHDIVEALRLGDRIAVINQGRLEQVGTKKEIIHNPSSSFVAALFKKAIDAYQEFNELLND